MKVRVIVAPVLYAIDLGANSKAIPGAVLSACEEEGEDSVDWRLHWSGDPLPVVCIAS